MRPSGWGRDSDIKAIEAAHPESERDRKFSPCPPARNGFDSDWPAATIPVGPIIRDSRRILFTKPELSCSYMKGLRDFEEWGFKQCGLGGRSSGSAARLATRQNTWPRTLITLRSVGIVRIGSLGLLGPARLCRQSRNLLAALWSQISRASLAAQTPQFFEG